MQHRIKPIIIAISGVSGSGKTHLSKFLRKEYGIPMIVSTTTRPPRADEVEGEDYFFVSAVGHKRQEMLTYTRFGEHEYYSLKAQLPVSGFCSYIVEENGIQTLKQTAGEQFGVFSVTVQCKEEIRLARGVEPERIERDKNRMGLGYEWVDYALFNNGTVHEFEQAARNMICVLETWQHLQ